MPHRPPIPFAPGLILRSREMPSRRIRLVSPAPDGARSNGAVLCTRLWTCQDIDANGADSGRPTRIQEHTLIRAWREVADGNE